MTETKKIRVAILDDHQGVIDGYQFRLLEAPDIEVVATMLYGEELEPALKLHETDVLLLDVQVPTSPTNPNPFPILYLLSNLLKEFPKLSIIIISMHAQRSMIHTLMEGGASGYILKEDHSAIRSLPSIIRNVYDGGIYMSQLAYQELMKSRQRDFDQPISTRQREVLSLCAAYPDASTAELAQRLGVAHSTLRNLLSVSYFKLGVSTRAAAIAEARRRGLIAPD